ncbi:hypothetical protein Y032_0101g3404 [Ancylostoma ceylanicum]|nr:hypothetical protein Y032_0101g3404 [Ancylostoma ceylanicum]
MILREAGLKVHKEVEGHLITEQAKVKRLGLCKRLRKRLAADRHRAILLSDEKWFDIEKAHNHQNDQMWSKGKVALEERMIYRRLNIGTSDLEPYKRATAIFFSPCSPPSLDEDVGTEDNGSYGDEKT